MNAPIVAAVLAAILMAGCATNRPLTDEGLALTVRIAVRHAIANSADAARKAQNIRDVVLRLQTVVNAETTVAGLKAEVIQYLNGLSLSPVQRSDAVDVLNYFAAVIEGKVGPERFDNARLVQVRTFLDLILQAIPLAIQDVEQLRPESVAGRSIPRAFNLSCANSRIAWISDGCAQTSIRRSPSSLCHARHFFFFTRSFGRLS